MNPAGILLVIAGTWVIAQITAGKALERMGLVKPDDGGKLVNDPAGVLGQIPPVLPGGSRNPPYIDLGRIGNAFGG